MSVKQKHLVFAALLLFEVATIVFAQSDLGEISGAIRTLKGPIGSATVSVADRATSQVYRVSTDASGFYSIKLPPGEYSLTVTADGFQQGRILLRKAKAHDPLVEAVAIKSR